MLPLIGVYGTGGTIATTGSETSHGKPRLSIADLAQVLPGLDEIARLQLVRFRQVPSVELALPDVVGLEARLRAGCRQGVQGFVVTQGTDTLEECAFALDLLWDEPVPIVITGAMRLANAPGADGPANLLSAIRVAASPQARGLGCLVVFNDEIHSARYVAKQHTTSPSAFASPGRGPIGSISEGIAHIWGRPNRPPVIPLRPSGDQVPVALIRIAIGDDGGLIPYIRAGGYAAADIAGRGGGHVPRRLVRPLERLAQVMPVVLSSRVGSGFVLTSTYGFRGSETDLDRSGLLNAGGLDGLKARVLLSLLLMEGRDIEAIRAVFRNLGD